jgi:hypothetical protein
VIRNMVVRLRATLRTFSLVQACCQQLPHLQLFLNLLNDCGAISYMTAGRGVDVTVESIRWQEEKICPAGRKKDYPIFVEIQNSPIPETWAVFGFGLLSYNTS